MVHKTHSALYRFIKNAVMCVVAGFFVCAPMMSAHAVTAPALGDVGDHGTWLTDHNRNIFMNNLRSDMVEFQSEFQKTQIVDDYVPPEARVGIAFINAMARIGHVLDISLVRFISIFILAAYTFWLMLEAYRLINATAQIWPTVENMVKKGFLIIIWIIVLNMGPARLFMWLMAPILELGTYMADLILNATAATINISIPDTCAAIKSYAAANISSDAIIDVHAAANMICLPTRLSGFFYTAIAAGWKLMIGGLGASVSSFVCGVIFIVIFMINIWKFTLMGLGVIADLFLAIFMLPFTAVAETIGKTEFSGIAGNIFNGFLEIFNTQSLAKQIERFINAAVFFVSLSIVISVCAALLSGIMKIDATSATVTINNTGAIMTILVGCLIGYLADKAKSIAGDLGGSVDDTIGQQFGKDVVGTTKNIGKQARNYWKLYKESKK